MLSVDVLPNVQLCPIREREDSNTFSRVFSAVIEIPKLWALIFRVPSVRFISKGENALFSSAFLLIASGTAEGDIEPMGIKCLLCLLYTSDAADE